MVLTKFLFKVYKGVNFQFETITGAISVYVVHHTNTGTETVGRLLNGNATFLSL